MLINGFLDFAGYKRPIYWGKSNRIFSYLVFCQN